MVKEIEGGNGKMKGKTRRKGKDSRVRRGRKLKGKGRKKHWKEGGEKKT